MKGVRHVKRNFCAKSYRILDIDSRAGPDQIRSAYLRQARKWHPDMHVNAGEQKQKEADQRFREIQEAYETLKNVKTQRTRTHSGHRQSQYARKQTWEEDPASHDTWLNFGYGRGIATFSAFVMVWILYANYFLKKKNSEPQHRTEDPRRRAENIVTMNERLKQNNSGVMDDKSESSRPNVEQSESEKWAAHYAKLRKSPAIVRNPARLQEVNLQAQWRAANEARKQREAEEKAQAEAEGRPFKPKENPQASTTERAKKERRKLTKKINKLNTKIADLSNRNAKLARENRKLRQRIRELERNP